jgi:hypothetical protein
MIGGLLISTALLALVMPQSAAYPVAYAQTPPGSSLTVDALDNATYQPLGADTFGDTVQLVDGGYEAVLSTGDHVGIHQASYVFGDLNGDGADDAVAIVIEQVGCCASSAQVVLAAYVNDSGAAMFAGSVPLGASSVVKGLTIQSGIITVTGLDVGPNDPFCCPTQPYSKQFALGEGGLVAASPAPTQPARPAPTGAVAGGLPVSTTDLSSVRSGFPGQVLVPPPGLQPFAPLQLSLVQSPMQSGSVGVTGEPLVGVYPQSYAAFFVNAHEQSQRQFGVAEARVAGATSRQMYDDTATDLVKTFAGCGPSAAYCGRPKFPQCTGIPCTIQAEIFRGLTVNGSNALVQHWQDQHDWAWDITWFDSQAGVTYSLSTENGADPSDFDKGLSAANQAGAQQLAAVAEKLVTWTGT